LYGNDPLTPFFILFVLATDIFWHVDKVLFDASVKLLIIVSSETLAKRWLW